MTQWDNTLHSESEGFRLESHWCVRSYCGNQRYYDAPGGLWEVKILGWFAHIGYKKTQFRISFVWHFFTLCTIQTKNISMKVLLGNKLNDLYLDNIFFFFDFQVLFLQSFVLILVKELKYSFIRGNSFWLTLFWVRSLEFLSTIFVSANWETVFNLEILSWLLLDTKQRN